MDNEKQPENVEEVTQSQSGPDQTRRRLTGSALGVSAIFTLASRPVLAMECLSPSGFASGNLSHHGAAQTCIGNSPAQWVNRLPDDGTGGNSKFKDEFTHADGTGIGVNWGNDRLKAVMNAGDNVNVTPKPNPISKEFAAALLNIRAGLYNAGIDETGLKGMWTEYATTGYYQVTAGPCPGSCWGPAQIVAYLVYLRS